MRIYALWILVFALVIYAWRDTLIPICGLVVLSVVMQRRDFPSYMMGINGLNPWNLLLISIVAATVFQASIGRIKFDMPSRVKWMLVVFYACIFVAYVRAMLDIQSIPAEIRPGAVGLAGEFFINRIKFVLPGLLLFVRCRSRKDLTIAVWLVIFCAVAYALLVIKHVPIRTLFSGSEEVFMRYRHRIDRDIGLMAIDMSMLLAGSFWGLLAALVCLTKRRVLKILGIVPLAVIFLGMALCHSRGSYVGFAASGMVLAFLRWRKLLVLIPVCAALMFAFMPAIPARLGMGIGVQDTAGDVTNDLDEITAGRFTDLWPAAIDFITASPVLGYGGYACLRTGIRERWLAKGDDAPFHPHNAYFELLLDMGLLGFIPVMVLYVGILVLCLRTYRNRSDNLAGAIGGMGLSMITVLLVTSLGAQSFYPGQSTVLYWCIWSLALRVSLLPATAPQRLMKHQRSVPRQGMRANRSRWVRSTLQ